MGRKRVKYENKGIDQYNETKTFFNNRDDPLLSRKEAARYTGRSPGTLAVIDCNKTYDLQPVKIRGRVFYLKSVLDQFLSKDLLPE